MIEIPIEYKVINSRAFMLLHHSGVNPLLLKNVKTGEYAVFCPECGLRVDGATDNIVLDSWNKINRIKNIIKISDFIVSYKTKTDGKGNAEFSSQEEAFNYAIRILNREDIAECLIRIKESIYSIEKMKNV